VRNHITCRPIPIFKRIIDKQSQIELTVSKIVFSLVRIYFNLLTYAHKYTHIHTQSNYKKYFLTKYIFAQIVCRTRSQVCTEQVIFSLVWLDTRQSSSAANMCLYFRLWSSCENDDAWLHPQSLVKLIHIRLTVKAGLYSDLTWIVNRAVNWPFSVETSTDAMGSNHVVIGIMYGNRNVPNSMQSSRVESGRYIKISFWTAISCLVAANAHALLRSALIDLLNPH
jgi:hypothetical protein